MPPEADDGLRVVWHYTCGRALESILRDGVIRPSQHGPEPAAVWFSFREDFDPATNLGARWSPEDMERIASLIRAVGITAAVRSLPTWSPDERIGGLARIGVAPEAAPFTWEDFCRVARLPQWYADGRVEADSAMGSDPADWRVSFAPVPSSAWVAVEARSGVRAGERWEPVTP